jgi:hypothetical protein
MTWLIADTSWSSNIYQFTDNLTFWEFTQYSKYSSKIRDELHASILRSMWDAWLGTTDYIYIWEPLRFLISCRNSIQSAPACGAAVPLPPPSRPPHISIPFQPLHLPQITIDTTVSPFKILLAFSLPSIPTTPHSYCGYGYSLVRFITDNLIYSIAFLEHCSYWLSSDYS